MATGDLIFKQHISPEGDYGYMTQNLGPIPTGDTERHALAVKVFGLYTPENQVKIIQSAKEGPIGMVLSVLDDLGAGDEKQAAISLIDRQLQRMSSGI